MGECVRCAKPSGKNMYCSVPCRTAKKNCLNCGEEFKPHHKDAKYCSRPCLYNSLKRDERYNCLGCSKEFIPKEKNRAKYCSRECRFLYMSNTARQAKISRNLGKVSDNKGVYIKCLNCFSVVIFFGRVMRKYCSSIECLAERARQADKKKNKKKYVTKSYQCLECGFQYLLNYGQKNYKYCSALCRRKAHHRMQAHAKRARLRRVAWEKIYPLEVFRRANYICYLCGVKTDIGKRGTKFHLAPELEHIIPISKGGPHTWDNVACACRSCNSLKGAKLLVRGEEKSYQFGC